MKVERPVATFSIVARDVNTGDLGVAVASKFLAVGAVVPYAQAGVGAVATQSYVNADFGPEGLRRLGEGGTPESCLAAFRESDPDLASRQFGMVAADGSSLSFTGEDCHAWAGGRSGPNYSVQGNILTDASVVDALEQTFLNENARFPERLVTALLAADRAGGDRRGRQSAALLVVGEAKGYGGQNDRWIDLRVDDHNDPVPELMRLLQLHQLYFGEVAKTPYVLSERDISWVQGKLREQGLLEQAASGQWDEATERALRGLYGIENLEERWLGGPEVDPVAWKYLKGRLEP